jgi:hypothetical protein
MFMSAGALLAEGDAAGLPALEPGAPGLGLVLPTAFVVPELAPVPGLVMLPAPVALLVGGSGGRSRPSSSSLQPTEAPGASTPSSHNVTMGR